MLSLRAAVDGQIKPGIRSNFYIYEELVRILLRANPESVHVVPQMAAKEMSKNDQKYNGEDAKQIYPT